MERQMDTIGPRMGIKRGETNMSDARQKPQCHLNTFIQGLFGSGKLLEVKYNSECPCTIELNICDVDDSEKSISIDSLDLFRTVDDLRSVMRIKSL